MSFYLNFQKVFDKLH